MYTYATCVNYYLTYLEPSTIYRMFLITMFLLNIIFIPFKFFYSNVKFLIFLCRYKLYCSTKALFVIRVLIIVFTEEDIKSDRRIFVLVRNLIRDRVCMKQTRKGERGEDGGCKRERLITREQVDQKRREHEATRLR